MSYQAFATYTDIPPIYGKEPESFYDRGQGIPPITQDNVTVQDLYRTPFLFLQEHRKNYNNLGKTAVKGILQDNELSKIFFSDENFVRLQRMIKNAVYERTNKQFRLDIDQEQRDLYLIMRAVYFEYARYLPGQLIRQVKKLNIKVIDEAVPEIITSIKQEYGYLKEINKPIDPIPRPINTSNAGRKSLASTSTAYGF